MLERDERIEVLTRDPEHQSPARGDGEEDDNEKRMLHRLCEIETMGLDGHAVC